MATALAIAGVAVPVRVSAAPISGPLERSLAAYAERLAVDRGEVTSFAARATTQSRSGKAGHGVLFWMGVGAGAGLVTAAVINATPSCRNAESLCPIGYATFPAFGAFIGFMVGA